MPFIIPLLYLLNLQFNKRFAIVHYMVPAAYVLLFFLWRDYFLFYDEGSSSDATLFYTLPIAITFLLRYIKNEKAHKWVLALNMIVCIPFAVLTLFMLGMLATNIKEALIS